MRRHMLSLVKYAIVIGGGVLVLTMADFFAIVVGKQTSEDTLLALISKLVASGVIGTVGGRLLPGKWYLVALVPIIYFADIVIRMQNIRLLWLGLDFPLVLITLLTIAYHAERCARLEKSQRLDESNRTK